MSCLSNFLLFSFFTFLAHGQSDASLVCDSPTATVTTPPGSSATFDVILFGADFVGYTSCNSAAGTVVSMVVEDSVPAVVDTCATQTSVCAQECFFNAEVAQAYVITATNEGIEPADITVTLRCDVVTGGPATMAPTPAPTSPGTMTSTTELLSSTMSFDSSSDSDSDDDESLSFSFSDSNETATEVPSDSDSNSGSGSASSETDDDSESVDSDSVSDADASTEESDVVDLEDADANENGLNGKNGNVFENNASQEGKNEVTFWLLLWMVVIVFGALNVVFCYCAYKNYQKRKAEIKFDAVDTLDEPENLQHTNADNLL